MDEEHRWNSRELEDAIRNGQKTSSFGRDKQKPTTSTSDVKEEKSAANAHVSQPSLLPLMNMKIYKQILDKLSGDTLD